MPLPRKKNKQNGQILLSILISLAVFSILVHAIFTLTASSFDLVNFNRARITARHLAQEKIELARNISYNNVGTVGGIPEGILDQEENIVRNGLNFTVSTSIIFIDDPFDDVAPTDTDPEDYKRVRVEISWEGLAASRKNPIILITDIAAQTSTTSSGGTLTIYVFDANNQPVPQADVTISAPSLDPPISLSPQTDGNGRVNLPGTPACTACYEITVTKQYFSTDKTYSESEVANPLKPHTTVIENEVTQVSFFIDEEGIINISSKDSRENNFAAKPNATFRLKGSKIIGTDVLGQTVHKYDQNHSTDDSGNTTLSNMEWDTYQILMPSATTLDISGSTPLQPISLLPIGEINFDFATVVHSDHNFLTIVKDPAQNLIASASARFYNGAGYEEIKLTGISDDPDFGQTFFSSLEEKTYQLEATASGYLDYNGNFDVSGYTVGEVILTLE